MPSHLIYVYIYIYICIYIGVCIYITNIYNMLTESCLWYGNNAQAFFGSSGPCSTTCLVDVPAQIFNDGVEQPCVRTLAWGNMGDIALHCESRIDRGFAAAWPHEGLCRENDDPACPKTGGM